jgi:hypothetical protein
MLAIYSAKAMQNRFDQSILNLVRDEQTRMLQHTIQVNLLVPSFRIFLKRTYRALYP